MEKNKFKNSEVQMFVIQGGDAYIRTDKERLAHEIRMPKINFESISRKFVWCFIDENQRPENQKPKNTKVTNKFARSPPYKY